MDLRSGFPLWPELSPDRLDAAPLDRDEACDVLVVGSGISGALAAFHLIEAGLDVVIVDRRLPVRGSTPASTALIQYEPDLLLRDLASIKGLETARRIYLRLRRAADDLAELIRREMIECDLEERPTLYVASGAEDLETLREESRLRADLGMDVRFVEEAELVSAYALRRKGAIRSGRSYQLDPWKLTQQLLLRCIARGARLYPRTTIQVPFDTACATPIRTDTGHAIRCRHLLLASGYETPQQFPFLRHLTTLKSTYALATAPLDPGRLWHERALIWEHRSPYFYARTTRDNRILIGGEDVEIVDAGARDALIGAKVRTLLDALDRLTGIRVEQPEFAWAGTFAETPDSLPYIGAAPQAPRCLLSLGYGGNGFVFSLLAAQCLRDEVMGARGPDADLFDFGRVGGISL